MKEVIDVDRDQFIQIWIVACSAAAIFLLTSKLPRRRRLGCMIGLIGQPAWIVSALNAGQWGVLVLSCWFAISYARGLIYAMELSDV
jgi:hypothetical protein